ncbi:MAG: putative quinol monooxygenase [Promethearchaeota archaeon]
MSGNLPFFCFKMRVKEGAEEEYKQLSIKLTQIAREENKGCLQYTMFQNKDDPRDFMLIERWIDMDAVNARIKSLIENFGPPNPGETFPAKLWNLVESATTANYELIE